MAIVSQESWKQTNYLERLPRFHHTFTWLKFVGLPFVLAGWMLGDLPTRDGA